ncbi:MAG: DUF6483 family protein [Clostridium perfringens]|nr:DUF6483 family protein [Clostridium perfringens]
MDEKYEDEKNIINLNSYIVLRELINNGDFNDGEDFLFENIVKEPSLRGRKIAFWFYKRLMNKSDDELTKGNFTRDEIIQGLADIKKLFTLI